MVAALVIEDGRILLCRRAPGQKLAGFWEFPGGKVEQGETDKESLERELREELGIVTKAIKHVSQNVHHYSDISITLALYLTKIVSGEIVHTVHDKTEWVIKKELPSINLAPADIPFVKKILSEEFQ